MPIPTKNSLWYPALRGLPGRGEVFVDRFVSLARGCREARGTPALCSVETFSWIGRYGSALRGVISSSCCRSCWLIIALPPWFLSAEWTSRHTERNTDQESEEC